MNYKKHYARLIRKRLRDPITEGYTEKHHIHPRSLGGTNDSNNIVVLTAREHYIAHFLLLKMYKGKCKSSYFKMLCAFNFMNKQESGSARGYVGCSRTFSKMREEFYNLRKGARYYHNTETGDINIYFEGEDPKGWVRGYNLERIPSKDTLKELCTRKTIKDISEEFGVNVKTVSRWKRKYDIKECMEKKSKKPSKKELERLVKKYSKKEIADRLQVELKTIYMWLNSYEITYKVESSKPPKKVLIQLIEKYSKKEIANQFNVTPVTIYAWLKSYDIKYKKVYNIPSKEELINLLENYNKVEIANKLGVSRRKIYDWKKQYGI